MENKKLSEVTLKDLKSVLFRHFSVPITVIGLSFALAFYLVGTQAKNAQFSLPIPGVGQLDIKTQNALLKLKEEIKTDIKNEFKKEVAEEIQDQLARPAIMEKR